GRIHHAQQGGGYLHHGHSPQPGGGHETGQVGGGPATEAHHDVVTGEPRLPQRRPALGRHGMGLGGLALGGGVLQDLVARLGELLRHGPHGLGQRAGVHQEHPHTCRQLLVQRIGGARTDQHLVVVFGPYGHRGGRAHPSSSSVRTASRTCSGVRPSVGTVWAASRSYTGRRRAISCCHCRRGLSTSSGLLRARPTRLVASATPTSRKSTSCPRNSSWVAGSITAPPPRASTPS